MSSPSNGPLRGVRVIDLSSVVSGPACSATLADQGADVIKVETLSGDLMRHSNAVTHGLAPSFISCNRGKRSIALNLKHDDGAEILWKLIHNADVFMQNFRPGAIERLGFGEPQVRARNTRIVYLSISGVGEQGPYAKKRVYDPVIQALSGFADIQSDSQSGRPRMVRTIVADKTTGIYAAQALTAALFHRERSGEGQHVRVSMLDTMVSFLWPEGMTAHTILSDGDEPAKSSTHDMIFATTDGYITVGAVSNVEWKGLCQALCKPHWINDPRFATQAARTTNRQLRLELVGEELRDNTRDHWLQALETADVPCAPVLRRREVIDDPQVRANGLVTEFDHPQVGIVRQARPAARFDRSGAAIGGPAPRLGEHTREILDEVGYSAEAISQMLDEGVIGELS
ncbi:MAG: crotonobetainyl-CoA:carnitine CoA-transferase CaiB-like acyl-CoA transferase [Gammaproteobacteria bacterium]|jgi:crotonobetainyl-CoA:carnitine CoA-transferase CaiB-like acyl-CoA transferase